MEKHSLGGFLGYPSINLPVRPTIARIAGFTVVVFVVLLLAFLQLPDNTLSFYARPDGPHGELEMAGTVLEIPADDKLDSFLSLKDAETLCAQDSLRPYACRGKHRKVYDLFLVGSELDWTEIRLNTLAEKVDYFVILEAERTFTNNSKPLYFKDNWKRFSKFESQIMYHVLTDDMSAGYTWARERYQRNALLSQVFPSLLSERAPNEGDVIIVSDVDEIPRPETIDKLRNCDIPDRVTLRSRFYLYSFQWHRDEPDWPHPQATYWQGEKTILPELLRMERTSHEISNASWHCTSCFATVKEMIEKVESFSHQEWNKPEFKDPDAIVARVRNGSDVFDRGFKLEKVGRDQMDVPAFVWEERERFAYLLDRDPPDASFEDYLPPR